jgi:hypothetical protein
VLRATVETETTQENIQNWLQLDEGNPGFQLPTEEIISPVIYSFLFIFISTNYIKFSIYLFSKFVFCLLRQTVASLIRMTSRVPPPPQLIWTNKSLLYKL